MKDPRSKRPVPHLFAIPAPKSAYSQDDVGPLSRKECFDSKPLVPQLPMIPPLKLSGFNSLKRGLKQMERDVGLHKYSESGQI